MITNAVDLVEPNARTADPWRIIKESAEAQGIKIRFPKENCRRCHGRGWIGRMHDTGAPIACSCIIVKEKYESERELGDWSKPINREQRRAEKKNKTKEKK